MIIASTDLSHYHPYDIAVSLDKKVQQLIENYSTEAFQAELLNNNIEMCGGGPVASSMRAAKILGANSSKILYYQNSGDITGDRSAVVGYLSAVFYKT